MQLYFAVFIMIVFQITSHFAAMLAFHSKIFYLACISHILAIVVSDNWNFLPQVFGWARDYVHSIFKIWSTPDFNFPLAKFQIWSTPDFHFLQTKLQNLEYSRFQFSFYKISNLEYSRFSFFETKLQNLEYSRF